jgi:hypothetical protein
MSITMRRISHQQSSNESKHLSKNLRSRSNLPPSIKRATETVKEAQKFL